MHMRRLLKLERNQQRLKLKMMRLCRCMMMHLLMRRWRSILHIFIQIWRRRQMFKSYFTILRRRQDNKKLQRVSKRHLILHLSQLILRKSLTISSSLNLFQRQKETRFLPGSSMKFALTFLTISSSLIFFKVWTRKIKLSYLVNFQLSNKSAVIIFKVMTFLTIAP